jgi:hypothetical protein
LDTRKVNALEYKLIWKLWKPLVNLKVWIKLFHDLKLCILEVIMAFVFLELGGKWNLFWWKFQELHNLNVGNCEICLRELFHPYCCKKNLKRFSFLVWTFRERWRLGLSKLFNKWKMLNLVGFMGDSSGRRMVFCYWWNERRKPCCRKLETSVGRTFLLWNNSNRSWQFME